MWRQLGILLLAAIAAVVVVFARRPDAFTNAQFYAEDGALWFADAYDRGPWSSLFVSWEGYFQLLPRLTALAAAPFGSRHAPLIYNVVGLVVQIAPVLLIVSNRFRSVVPSLRARVAISAIYLLVPSTELNVDITAAHFHLAILGALILVAAPSRAWAWRAIDVSVIAICALTGPFAYILLPAAMLCWWLRRQRWTLVLGGVLGLGLALQLYAATLSPRSHFGLGASLHDFLLLICDRVILAGLFAEEGHTHVFVAGMPHGTLIAAVICLSAAPLVVAAAIRAPWELRIFGLIAIAMLLAGLWSPLVSAGGNQWDIMVNGRAGERYFFMAQVTWVVTLVWAASRLRQGWARLGLSTATAAAFGSGLIAVWAYPAFTDYHWGQAVQEIQAAPTGSHVSVPINPGPPWAVNVIVH